MAQWPSKGSNSDLIDLYWEKLPKYAHAEQLNGAAVSATGDYYTVDRKKTYLFTWAWKKNFCYNTERFLSLTNQNTKRKTEIKVFSDFGDDISRDWEQKSTSGRFAKGRFWPCTWKISVGKAQVNN